MRTPPKFGKTALLLGMAVAASEHEERPLVLPTKVVRAACAHVFEAGSFVCMRCGRTLEDLHARHAKKVEQRCARRARMARKQRRGWA